MNGVEPRDARSGDGGPENDAGDGVSGRSRRVLWFLGFYAFSLISFTAVVYALRYIVRG